VGSGGFVCFFVLKKKEDRSSKLTDLFCENKWSPVVCYLADTFEKTNTLSVSLPGESDILTIRK